MALLRRGWPPGMMGLAALVLLLAWWVMSPGVVRGILRERVFDQILPRLHANTSKEPGVVIVDIDRTALSLFGTWPWPRQRLAAFVAAVAEGHPAAIGVDILLAGPDRFSAEGDTALAQALSGAPVGTRLRAGYGQLFRSGPACHANPCARGRTFAGPVAGQWGDRPAA